MMELGGNIKLDGFHDIDTSSMIVVKKIVGNYAKRFQEETSSFQELSLHIVNFSKENIEVRAALAGDKHMNAQVSDVNLFFAIDKALAQLMAEIKKK